jgi:hypothetical protein
VNTIDEKVTVADVVNTNPNATQASTDTEKVDASSVVVAAAPEDISRAHLTHLDIDRINDVQTVPAETP